MDEKEIKKLDENNEKEVSGGGLMKINGVEVGEDKVKEILAKRGIDIEELERYVKKPRRPHPAIEYGAPMIHTKKLLDEDFK